LLPFPYQSDVAAGMEDLPRNYGIAVVKRSAISAAQATDEVAKRCVAEVAVAKQERRAAGACRRQHARRYLQRCTTPHPPDATRPL